MSIPPFQYLMKLHYSQTRLLQRVHRLWFQYLMKLHYSQTQAVTVNCSTVFQYLMKLHYSQTGYRFPNLWELFQYLMKLHYSQTDWMIDVSSVSFSTLWNYTTLKPIEVILCTMIVSVPYEITLLSNPGCGKTTLATVSVPYEITLLSNKIVNNRLYHRFQYLMKLHYSQTWRMLRLCFPLFQYLMKLHYSQTSNKLRHYNAQGNNIRYIYYTI